MKHIYDKMHTNKISEQFSVIHKDLRMIWKMVITQGKLQGQERITTTFMEWLKKREKSKNAWENTVTQTIREDLMMSRMSKEGKYQKKRVVINMECYSKAKRKWWLYD